MCHPNLLIINFIVTSFSLSTILQGVFEQFSIVTLEIYLSSWKVLQTLYRFIENIYIFLIFRCKYEITLFYIELFYYKLYEMRIMNR